MRGRKKKPNSFSESICIKLTKEQKETWDKNKCIAAEARAVIRNYIDLYAMKK